MKNEWTGRIKDYTLNSGLIYWLVSSEIIEIGNTGGEVGQRKRSYVQSKCLEFVVSTRNPSKEIHGSASLVAQ